MERKLVLQGNNSFTVSLPINWIRAKGLDKKSVVNIEESGDELRISSKYSKILIKTEVNVIKKERLEAMQIIESKYLQGYDEIKIKHDNLKNVKEISANLIGMVIETYKPNELILKSITKDPSDELNNIIRKMIFLLKEQSKSLVRLAKKEIDLNTALAEESILDSNNMYALRYLNKYLSENKASALSILCSVFDMASDLMGEIAKHIGNDTKNAKLINHYVEGYCDGLLKGNLHEINKLLLDETKYGRKTFMDGLIYSLTETMYNYLGFVVDSYAELNQ